MLWIIPVRTLFPELRRNPGAQTLRRRIGWDRADHPPQSVELGHVLPTLRAVEKVGANYRFAPRVEFPIDIGVQMLDALFARHCVVSV